LTATLSPHTDPLAPEHLDPLILAALAEDVGEGDLTSDAILPPEMTCRGKIVCKQDGVIAGLPVAERVFKLVDERLQFDAKTKDGEKVQEDAIVARLYGPARAMLRAERVALNYLQHLSGIATITAKYVKAVEGTKTEILDTRKTTPGLRVLEKQAVLAGGGHNHRAGLFDAILVKENHAAMAGGVGEATRLALAAGTGLPVEVECASLGEVREALAAGAPRILLDNMTNDELREAVSVVAGRAELEASGGVSLGTVRAIAETGVDFISVGALTHSAPALDVSLILEPL
jgi:nicotinate-nucleotide pyrophosphorylase (carboxylating)